MNTADQLIQGYTAYTTAEEFGAAATSGAPATTPSIATASSPECAGLAWSAVQGAAASLGAVTATHVLGC
ncbi:LxmA leader domain family RiPP [Kitasatospora sp. NPDC001159]|uniref:LxmA leader domain family RiPP n=1 Tax=Kitasatospora sp. NPDC018058 TaxID=3364025 RepID=UPI0037C10BCF